MLKTFFCNTVGLVTVVLSENYQVDVMKGDFVGIDLSTGPAAIALVPERGSLRQINKAKTDIVHNLLSCNFVMRSNFLA